MSDRKFKVKQYTKNTANLVLETFQEKNVQYKGQNRSMKFHLNSHKTMFEVVGMFGKNGKVYSYDTLVKKYGANTNYKISLAEYMLSDKYVSERWEQTKDSFAKMAQYVDEELSNEIEEMSMSQFQKNFIKGKYEDIKEQYDFGKQTTVAENISQNYDDYDSNLDDELGF